MTPGIQRRITERQGLYNKYKKYPSGYNYDRLTKSRKLVKSLIRQAKRKEEIRVAELSKQNVKSFFSYVNSRKPIRHKLGPIKDQRGVLQYEDKGIAGAFNEFFASVFTVEDLSNIPEPTIKFHKHIEQIHCTNANVECSLDKLNKYKSPGPDNIVPLILKNVQNAVIEHLVQIFNYSINSNFIPEDWKLANVTPIYKKGNKNMAGNYRPISLTSVIGKLLENIITNHIRNYLEVNNLISDSQHGFRKKRSCLTNLLEFFHDIYQDYDSYKNVDLIYLDFQKAFDSVPHKRLMTKIRALGVGGKLADWIENWLRNRKQRVVINGEASDWVEVTSGVPQGSILGPLLFVIYINDLDSNIVNKLVKFADDAKLGGRVDDKRYIISIQEDLNRLVKWTEKWQMNFNLSKCKVMHIGHSNEKNIYQMDSIKLKETNSEKDLGIVITNNFKSTNHCIQVEKKCNRLLGYIKRQFLYRNKNIVVTLYKSLILPHLEYCVQFWSPSLKKDIDRLERVQARATKLIPEIRHMSYENRLKILGMHTLKSRRIRFDLVQTYKILHGVDNVDYTKYFELNNNHTRNNGYKLMVKMHNTNILGNFFMYRVVNNWNKLPSEVVESNTVDIFKSKLDEVFNDLFETD